MKKNLVICGLGLILTAQVFALSLTDIPNESAFPAAKPIINANNTLLETEATNLASSNAFYATKLAAQAVSNATYALKSSSSLYVTNMTSAATSNILWFVSGVLTNVTTIP